MGAWTKIKDYTVPSNTTSVVLDNFGTITKDDFIKIVFTLIDVSTGVSVQLFPNNNTTSTNYHTQRLYGIGSTAAALRTNNAFVFNAEGQVDSVATAYLKLSENDRVNVFVNDTMSNNSNVINRFWYMTSSNATFTSGITSLTFAGNANIGTGSRIQIYKLTARKVADITVSANTTQVDIPVTQYYTLGSITNNSLFNYPTGFISATNWFRTGYITLNSEMVVVQNSNTGNRRIHFFDADFNQLGMYTNSTEDLQFEFAYGLYEAGKAIPVPEGAVYFGVVGSNSSPNGNFYYVTDNSLLSIDKDSEYLLVSDVTQGASTTQYRMFINDNTTLTNYWSQRIRGIGSTTNASRANLPLVTSITSNRTIVHSHIKLSNIGAYTSQHYAIVDAGTSSVYLENYFHSGTAENVTSITKLNLVSEDANSIGAGSRFILYKLY